MAHGYLAPSAVSRGGLAANRADESADRALSLGRYLALGWHDFSSSGAGRFLRGPPRCHRPDRWLDAGPPGDRVGAWRTRAALRPRARPLPNSPPVDRKSTRLNSS